MKAAWADVKDQNENTKVGVTFTVKLAAHKDLILKALDRHVMVELKVLKYGKVFWW